MLYLIIITVIWLEKYNYISDGATEKREQFTTCLEWTSHVTYKVHYVTSHVSMSSPSCDVMWLCQVYHVSWDQVISHSWVWGCKEWEIYLYRTHMPQYCLHQASARDGPLKNRTHPHSGLRQRSACIQTPNRTLQYKTEKGKIREVI